MHCAQKYAGQLREGRCIKRSVAYLCLAIGLSVGSVHLAQAQTVTAKGFYSQTANAQLRNEFTLQMNDLKNETERLGSELDTVQSQHQTTLQELLALREEVRWLQEQLNALSAVSTVSAPVAGAAVAPAEDLAAAMCASSSFPNDAPHLGHCLVHAVAHGQSSGACQHSYGSCRYRCVSGIWTREAHHCFDPSVNAGSQ